MKTKNNRIEHNLPSDEQLVEAGKKAVADGSQIIRTETIFSLQKPGDNLAADHVQTSLHS